MTMVRIFTVKLLVSAACLLPALAFGQVNLPQNGTWSGGKVSGNQTVTLNGNVRITGTIIIPKSASLTVTNSTNGEVNISRNTDIIMFNVESGGSLKIIGGQGKEIVIDGGANFTWNESEWSARKGKSWEQCGYGNNSYIPLTTTTSAMKNSMIQSNGELNFEYTRIQQFNAATLEKYALHIAYSNVKCGKTHLKNCEITLCRSEEGSAIFVGPQNGGNTGNNNENCAVTLENVTISRCMVNPNHTVGDPDGAAWGGVIRFRGGSMSNLSMTNCTMKQNYSTGDGSCLWWNAAGSETLRPTLVLNGCTFDDNRADRDAGAVRFESGFRFEGKTTVFKNNSCGRYGGAIQVADYNAGVVATNNFDYHLNEYLDVNNNYAAVGGGGVAFYYLTTILKENTEFNIHLEGLNVHSNKADERGGGILFTDLRPDGGNEYKFNIYMNKGTISNNTAIKAGGGIFARKMTILTNTSGDKVTISGNRVTAAEGVAGEEGAKGGGGGINLYDGTMHLNTCEITGNTVIGANGKTDLTNGYGGGIMLNRSTFTLDGSNNISGNRANVGGGVAALNETQTEHTVKLTSGNINGNTANLCGGGVAIVGNVKMTVSGVNIKDNKAINAGGIYMRGRTLENNEIAGAGATLTYTGGEITGNMAKATLEGEAVPPLTNTTAYQATTDKIKGIGGGICLGGNTTLEMLVTRNAELGIHDNIADNGADDVFCSGANGTTVVLPNVASMAVENGNRLFWVEDYITNDTKYTSGTAIDAAWKSDNMRYRNAKENHEMSKVFRLSQVVNGKQKYSFNESYKGSEAIYQKFTDKYMCLTLGEVFTNIILQKKGMAERDNAIFKIYRWELKEGPEKPANLKKDPKYLYMTMILTDRDKAGDDLRRKRIQADYGYYYYVEETPWSWAYDSTVDPANGVRRIDKDATNETERTFTFTNTPKSNTPKHAESVKVNVMPGKN